MLAPEWIPWKDRLLPTDISPTDVLGTEADDERLEPGVRPEQAELTDTQSTVAEEKTPENTEQNDAPEFRKTQSSALESVKTQELNSAEQVEQSQEYREIVEEFELSRSRVLSPAGRAQTAQRWYGGPHGPKSLSTRVATGKTCQTCGFFVHIQGELGTMFGVCANKWSQDDGRVVSLDHGCGEHSDIDPPEPSQLWIQPEPTVDDGDEIIIVSRPRVVKPSAEERGIADILEDMDDPDNLVDNTDTDNTDTHDSSDLDDE
ncbi:DUF3027 domain-containing protein [Alloscardovia omnicolens]|uniref:DUF3027 domain-containing protein n=1 Tax=Alloscardovia omnicolens TaxID=419015 RepID=UPI003AEFE3D4